MFALLESDLYFAETQVTKTLLNDGRIIDYDPLKDSDEDNPITTTTIMERYVHTQSTLALRYLVFVLTMLLVALSVNHARLSFALYAKNGKNSPKKSF